ncbi:MAG: type II toxin-antitoxin system HicB family antitoxin [Lachnospiraceae bacterium]|nr:type II toxin-antitoxin system HicB family antitoxin [Lachnospiraceae bacterium]
MAKYVYPAIFTPEEKGFSVNFPDLQGCYTCGDDLADAIYMAEDVLAFTLYDYEKNKLPIPAASSTLPLKTDEFMNMILCDTQKYHKRNNAKSVKKTLTIPEWLNESATAADINFSQVLQEALMQKLGIA